MGTGGTPAVRSPASCRICPGHPRRQGAVTPDDTRENFPYKERKTSASADVSQLNRLVGITLFAYLYKARLINPGRVTDASSKFYGQAERAISTRKLHALQRVHIEPIKQVVFLCPSFPLRVGRSHLEACFSLICIQRLSQPNFATQLCHWHDNWNTRGSSIPVLSY